MKAVKVCISLGSNQNNPINQLISAKQTLINQSNFNLIASSSIYQTSPWGLLNQPDFYNAVILGETDLSAENLLLLLQNIENQHHRKRIYKNAPRTLDLDIIFYGEMVHSDRLLTIPHQFFDQRAFVLVPLIEIYPDCVDPRNNILVKDYLVNVADQKINKLFLNW